MTETVTKAPSGAPGGPPAGAPRAGRPSPGRPRRRNGPHPLTPLLWIGPALLLIVGVVLWPVLEMALTSLREISRAGVVKGWAGLANYQALFDEPDLVSVLVRTVFWVVGVVAVTVFISLGLAQLLNARFPGRRLVRWALIVPWAASVVMTAIVWRWILDFFHGMANRVLMDLGLIDAPRDWLGEPGLAWLWLMWVAVFVSIPFTTYVILAGLQTIPGDIYEAAQVDGASRWRTYRSIVLPLLKPAVLVATVINVINVFNSFPIIWAMTRGGPGHDTDTTTTFMFKLLRLDKEVGQSAAMAVLNFVMIMVMVLFYLRAAKWQRDPASGTE
ncbi:MAG: carbohydrate ABC transporter permease [Thermocrispum sp.]